MLAYSCRSSHQNLAWSSAQQNPLCCLAGCMSSQCVLLLRCRCFLCMSLARSGMSAVTAITSGTKRTGLPTASEGPSSNPVTTCKARHLAEAENQRNYSNCWQVHCCSSVHAFPLTPSFSGVMTAISEIKPDDLQTQHPDMQGVSNPSLHHTIPDVI